MKKRATSNRAFTLIELLVVIAIIAILAAILFPVFAQAKAAAKATVAISNVKQINLAILIYANDADDNRVPRTRQDCAINAQGQCTQVLNEYDWKQLISPYVKSIGMFKDSVNPAAQFVALHSDPAARTFFGWTPVIPPSDLVFARGYAWADLWLGGSFQDSKSASMTQFDSPATTFETVETKEYGSDTGPFDQWTQNVDAQTSYIAANPTTGLQWNWGGAKWDNKAIAASYLDGHAKRQSFSAMCGNIFDKQAAGTSTPDAFNLSATSNPGSWADGVCSTLPTQFR